jgi:hypothetical protein
MFNAFPMSLSATACHANAMPFCLGSEASLGMTFLLTAT